MELIKAFGQHLKRGESLAPYTYIKIGGPADYLLTVKTTADLSLAVKLAHQDRVPLTVLGSASNVCISDHGLRGLVIINRSQKIVTGANCTVQADSGTFMSQLVNFTIANNMAGLEEFLGIPGTVGGAVVNNSHHLKHLIGDYIQEVNALDLTGNPRQYNQKECHFAYDQSIFQKDQSIILTVKFRLQPGDKQVLKEKAQAALTRRRQTQPLELKTSGCMFKNPPSPSPSAGFMIDQAGLKGFKLGGAQINDLHANFIVNTGNATASDIVALSNLVRLKIHNHYHLWLEREIFFLGSHPELETKK